MANCSIASFFFVVLLAFLCSVACHHPYNKLQSPPPPSSAFGVKRESKPAARSGRAFEPPKGDAALALDRVFLAVATAIYKLPFLSGVGICALHHGINLGRSLLTHLTLRRPDPETQKLIDGVLEAAGVSKNYRVLISSDTSAEAHAAGNTDMLGGSWIVLNQGLLDKYKSNPDVTCMVTARECKRLQKDGVPYLDIWHSGALPMAIADLMDGGYSWVLSIAAISPILGRKYEFAADLFAARIIGKDVTIRALNDFHSDEYNKLSWRYRLSVELLYLQPSLFYVCAYGVLASIGVNTFAKSHSPSLTLVLGVAAALIPWAIRELLMDEFEKVQNGELRMSRCADDQQAFTSKPSFLRRQYNILTKAEWFNE